MVATSAKAPPTAPPTMAPKLGLEGVVVAVGDEELVLVLVGELVDRDEPGVGVGEVVTGAKTGVLVAYAPTPDSVGLGPT